MVYQSVECFGPDCLIAKELDVEENPKNLSLLLTLPQSNSEVDFSGLWSLTLGLQYLNLVD